MSHYWIDTDPGLDDALAILLAIREVGSDLVGLSTVQGNGPEPASAWNLSRLLTVYAERGVTPPGWQPLLVRGCQQPLVRERFPDATIHGPQLLGGLNWTASPEWERWETTSAPEALARAIDTWPDLCLVCIGPLTNLAMALRLAPERVTKLHRLVIMGGSLRAGGNATAAAEYNFASDPESARAALEAGFTDVRVVPMDACLSACMTRRDLERIQELGSAAATTAVDLLAHWHDRIDDAGFAVYDPLAWLATTRPELVTWEDLYVTVDTGRDVAYGASIADWHGKSGRSPNVKAGMRMDRNAAFDRMVELLS